MKLIPKMLLGLGLAALPAFCGAITLESRWYTFQWDGTVLPLATLGSAGYTSVNDSTVILGTTTGAQTFSGAENLAVQDLFFNGDVFNIYDGVNLIGTTTPTTNTGINCGDGPVACAAESTSSKILIALGAGSHSITFTVIQESTGHTTGRAIFELLPTQGCQVDCGGGGVPEPATMGMMGLGLGLGGVLLRWRKRK